ncbi:MAG TPA: TlpA disulfide reductase family protein, partial [Vicinamibacterales bacterium]|nr:TlpA disulfide reductase family protein [Vicinamibacterales bacterium]
MLSNKAASLIGAALLAVSVMWLGTRYSQRYAPAPAEDSEPSKEPLTVRFFRDPKPVSEFAVRTIDGHDLTSASLRGRVTIVNFWATWCPPCRAEIPDLVKLQDKYRNQLQIVGISEDEDGPGTVDKVV